MKVSLAPHLGKEDIVLGSYQELMRESGFFRPENIRQAVSRDGVRELATGLLRRRDWRDSLNKAVKRRYKRAYGLSSSGHPPAVEVRQAFPEEWDSYFKFCFVRNPYERAVSDYLYLTRKASNPPTFSEYIRELKSSGKDFHGRKKHDNWPMYTIDEKLAVDFVGRYENLHGDFSAVMKQVGLPEVALTASEKRRDYPRPWRDYYGPGDREQVESLYGREIRFFGYEFGS